MEYERLYEKIMLDYNDPEIGEVVRQRIEDLKGEVMFTQIDWS